MDRIDFATLRRVASQALPARFTPFGLVTPYDRELYLVHKGAGTLSILRTDDLSVVVAGLPIGPRANRVWFVGRFAYITVGGPAPSAAEGDPAGAVVIVDRERHAVVGALTGAAFTGEPHGIWGTPDGRVYVGHERGNRVTVIDTGDPDDPADDRVAGTVGGPAEALAFPKQPITM